MKNTLLIICSFLFLGTTTTNAQLWKKLKQKAQEKIQKAEDKLVNGIDKTIDKTIDGKKEREVISEQKNTNIKNNKEKDFGDSTINHSNTYQEIKIKHLTQTSVNKNGNQFTISGHWWSSRVDVYDGYKITINNTSKEELMSGKTFQIPNEASLYIGYDPLLGDRENRKEKWKGSVKNEIESGTVKVQYVEGLSVQISFNANATLENYIENGSDGYYDKKQVTINGTLTTEDPSYSITKPFKEKNKTTKATEAEEAEFAKAILEKANPTVEIPSTFAFNKSITIEITDYRNDTQKIKLLLGEYPDIYGIDASYMAGSEDQGNSTMVMTPKASFAFIDMAGMKIKKAMSLDQLGDQFETQENLPEDEDFEYQKTGNTKTILGYTCHEYKVDYDYTNSQGSMAFWVSKDFPIQNKELPMLGMQLNNTNFSGFVLEMDGVHKGKTTSLKVIDIADTNLTINSNEYRKMGF